MLTDAEKAAKKEKAADLREESRQDAWGTLTLELGSEFSSQVENSLHTAANGENKITAATVTLLAQHPQTVVSALGISKIGATDCQGDSAAKKLGQPVAVYDDYLAQVVNPGKIAIAQAAGESAAFRVRQARGQLTPEEIEARQVAEALESCKGMTPAARKMVAEGLASA